MRLLIPAEFMEVAAPAQADHYFLKIVVDPSNYFKRDGLDVVTEADVSVAQALLGGQLRVRGLFEEKVNRGQTSVNRTEPGSSFQL
jgi:DnaJ-class molecular chaperone